MSGWLKARNLLAVRMDNIGDVVMLGPALRAIKESAPDTRITLLASPGGAVGAELLPWVDHVISWRASWQDVHGRVPNDPAYERELIDTLAERGFNAAVVFTSFSQTPHVPAYVCLLAGIPLRAGESKEFGGRVLTHTVQGTPEEAHQAERNLRLVESLGYSIRDRQLHLTISETARREALACLSAAGIETARRYILLHPGASAVARRYPAGRFGQVARLLGERGHQVLVTGVDRERELVEAILACAPDAHSLVGATDLPTYAALIERAALVICNNTLPMHLADAARTPSVVLYSGTDYERQWAPRAIDAVLLRRETPCHPCYLFECPIGQPCLDIPPQEVAAAASSLLAPRPLAVAGVS